MFKSRTSNKWTRPAQLVGVAAGGVLASGVAFAATNWAVGLAAGSTASAQGASISNLTISKVTSVPAQTNQLFPGGSGDVQFKISNTNPFPVTVTGLTIPAESVTTNDALGYSDATTGTAIAGCNGSGATASTVMWKSAASGSTTNVTFTPGTGFTLAAGSTGTPTVVTVTLTADATMDSTAPLACAGTQSGTNPNFTYAGAYFVLPSLTSVAATGGVFGGQPTVILNGGSVTTSY